MKIKYDDVGVIISYAVMKCPLCKTTYHTKGALRNHLKKEHTKSECEDFLKKNK